MARSRMKCETTVSFQLTFKLPVGMTITQAREKIKESLIEGASLGLVEPADIKVHLTNKEIKYHAQR